ncbi:heat shock protein transcriptional repressor HspR [Natronoglycomyces albus]|uniref:Helix-turn-helix transcriptional regulator n=1 Tax=Natronoglycomyces albus TaxID=2811108 RepID=A0A895XTD1_9ACTN|nr:helix-turn-helix transcriptional regulator [Natronoglycomyces albus]
MTPDMDAKVLVISVAAEMAGMHPQTLRQYDRLGLVQPDRTPGGGRRYSPRDVLQLQEIQRLSQDEGVNLAGIKRIMDLENKVRSMHQRLAEASEELRESQDELAQLRAVAGPFARRSRETALVLWRGEDR